MRRLSFAGLLVVLTALAAVFVSRAAAEPEPGVAYVSGLEIGPRKAALLRIANVSPSRFSYAAIYTVIAEDGNPLAVFTNIPVGFDDTLELDVGKAVNAHRLAVNPDAGTFAGRVQLIVRGEGGFDIEPFGQQTVVVEGVQKDRAATYQAAVDWG